MTETGSENDAAIVTAAILVIGDEILSGRTKDRNIGAIAERLTEAGIDLREVRIVRDVEAEIIAAVDALRAAYAYVFTTGGIGPTHDDITAEAIAKAFGVAIGVRADARDLMQAHYDQRGLELTPARLRMARIPDGATLIRNSISAAPGFKLGNVIVMAGVPDIMSVMLDAALPDLAKGPRVETETLALSCPESEVAELFAEHQRQYPRVAMGSYPRYRDGKPATDLVLRSADRAHLATCASALREKLGLAALA